MTEDGKQVGGSTTTDTAWSVTRLKTQNLQEWIVLIQTVARRRQRRIHNTIIVTTLSVPKWSRAFSTGEAKYQSLMHKPDYKKLRQRIEDKAQRGKKNCLPRLILL